MLRNRLNIVSVATICFVAGYMLGGWVYERGGAIGWAAIADWTFDYQGLVAGLMALVVGIAGWKGLRDQIDANRTTAEQQIAASRDLVERQIRAEEKRLTQSAKQRDTSVLATVNSTLTILQQDLLAANRDDSVFDILRSQLPEIMRIDHRIGTSIQIILRNATRLWSDFDQHKRDLRDLNDAETIVARIAVDIDLTTKAGVSAMDAISHGTAIPDVLVDDKRADASFAEFDVPRDDQRSVLRVLHSRFRPDQPRD